jgi:hypothetical protein
MLDDLAEARAKIDKVRERLKRASVGQEGIEELREVLAKLAQLSDEVGRVEGAVAARVGSILAS